MGNLTEDLVALASAQAKNIEQHKKNAALDIANQFLPQMREAQIGYKNAQTAKVPAEIQHLIAQAMKYNQETRLMPQEVSIKQQNANTSSGNLSLDQQRYSPDRLKLADEDTRSKIKHRTSQDNASRFGTGAGGKEEMLFESLIKKDNPQLTDDQVYEASNVLREGGTQLADGTKLNNLSAASKGSLDRLRKYGTTAQLINQSIGSEQASAEYEPLTQTIKKLNSIIGSTVGGQSASAIMNSYLGGKIGDQQMAAIMARGQLASAAATLQNRIETGQSFATIIGEILDRSGSDINATFAKVSPQARNMALDIVLQTMNEMYKARRTVGIGASNAYGNGNQPTNSPQITPEQAQAILEARRGK